MAALTNPTVITTGGGSGQPRYFLLGFQKVTAGDTYDLSTLSGFPTVLTVTSALFVATSNRTATTTLASIAGTVITMNGTGISSDAGYLFALGE